MDIHVDIRGSFEIHEWICNRFSDIGRRPTLYLELGLANVMLLRLPMNDTFERLKVVGLVISRSGFEPPPAFRRLSGDRRATVDRPAQAAPVQVTSPACHIVCFN